LAQLLSQLGGFVTRISAAHAASAAASVSTTAFDNAPLAAVIRPALCTNVAAAASATGASVAASDAASVAAALDPDAGFGSRTSTARVVLA
jgi:hypothetical protein